MGSSSTTAATSGENISSSRLEGPPCRALHVQGRDLALGRPVEVEQDLVHLREVLDPLGQALAGLVGVLDQVAAEAAGHAHEDELDGELHALVGVAVLAGQQQARQGHGQPGDDRHSRDDAQATGEPGDDGGDAQGDEERGAGEAGGLDHGHAHGHLEEQCGGRLPAAPLAPDGAQGPPQRVGDEHPAGHRGTGPAVLDEPEPEGQRQRHPAQGAERCGPNSATCSGEAGRRFRHPNGARHGRGGAGRHLVGKRLEHHCRGCSPWVRIGVVWAVRLLIGQVTHIS